MADFSPFALLVRGVCGVLCCVVCVMVVVFMFERERNGAVAAIFSVRIVMFLRRQSTRVLLMMDSASHRPLSVVTKK